jgi:proteasome lid subunit RPN8/RPN11
MRIDNLEEFKNHVLECYPAEAVGFVIEGSFVPLANIASSPFESFLVEAGTFITYEGTIDCILHSHTHSEACKDDPRTPSEPDMSLAKSTGLPQGICHTDGENVSDILYFNLKEPDPLLGRRYISGVYDCHSIVRDYYIMHYNYVMDIMPRDCNWVEDNPTYLVDNLELQGLVKVAKQELRVGDVLIFAYGTRYASHLGVYIGEGKYIHHLKNIPSCEDRLDKYPRQHLATYRLINE